MMTIVTAVSRFKATQLFYDSNLLVADLIKGLPAFPSLEVCPCHKLQWLARDPQALANNNPLWTMVQVQWTKGQWITLRVDLVRCPTHLTWTNNHNQHSQAWSSQVSQIVMVARGSPARTSSILKPVIMVVHREALVRVLQWWTMTRAFKATQTSLASIVNRP